MLDINNLVRSIANETMNKDYINKFVNEIEERLLKMETEEIKEYTIDRFEGDIAVLENRKTKEIININREDLPKDICEGTILDYKNNKFYKNEQEQEKIENRIKEKMNNLWNN